MFPVTHQVRRKRTPVFGRPGRIRGSADESEESGGERRSMRAEGGLGREEAEKAGAGMSQKQGRAWENARPTRRERGAGLGEDIRGGHEVPGQANASLAPDGQAAHRGLGRLLSPGDPSPRPPREPTMRSGRPRRRRRNAGADPLGHRSFMEPA